MNIVMTKDTVNIDDFYYGRKIENNIIPNSYFYNIFYSNKLLYINNVILKFRLNNVVINEYFNKFKCNFNARDNIETINFLTNLEKKILSLLNNDLDCNFKLREQLNNGEIKINNYTNKILQTRLNKLDILIKISGIWETQDEKGIIVKFLV